MNNLLEKVWHENPVIRGAIIGINTLEIQHEGEKVIVAISGKEIHAFKLGLGNPEDPRITVPIEKCVLLTRSIDSLTLEESCKIPSIQEEAETELRLVSLTDRIMWLNINIKLNRLSALDFFYLLSIGRWTGSPKNTEVIE
ncbi:MAG: hypothetical protein ABJG33_00185 [Balneola sp.]